MNNHRQFWHTLIFLTIAVAIGTQLNQARAAIGITICTGSAAGPILGSVECPGQVGPEDNVGKVDAKPGDQTVGNKICIGGKCISIPTATNTGLPTPAGWTNSTTPPTNGTPPTTVWVVSGVGEFASFPAACSAVRASQGRLPSSTPDNQAAGQCYSCSEFSPGCPIGGGASTDYATPGQRCAAGYGASGANCVLNNSNAVIKPSDGQCNIKRVGNTFSIDAQDPDCASTGDTPMNNSGGNVSNDTVSASAPGVATSTTINTGTGGATITVSRANANGTTTSTQVGVSAPNGSGGTAVTGTATTTYPGTGTLMSGTPEQPKPRDPCGLPGTPKCAMDETGTPTDGSLKGSKDAFDAASTARQDAVTGINESAYHDRRDWLRGELVDLLTVQWPNVSCVNPVIGVGAFHGVVHICEKADDIKGAGSFVVAVFALFSVFHIALGAIRGE